MIGEYELHIEPMQVEDIPRLVEITQQFYDTSEHTHYRQFDPACMASAYYKDFSRDDRCCFVARSGDEIYGAIRGYVTWSEWADENLVYENGWYILPEARKLGVGQTLLLALKNWAKKKDTAIVYVTLMGEPMTHRQIEKMGLMPTALMTKVV